MALFFAQAEGQGSQRQLCGYVGNWFLPDPNRMYGCVLAVDSDFS